ncbi:hypothetical protein ANPL_00390 [Anaplasma platys]|uniref:Uncharacterized protein n=1 Tax=Anaplasma platys TaxID=949 RepID=A0A858PX95_9RICK|nr:hypothetical protein [Anaplasma platys]QJC27200.1 hypothetical protein ANPL_00390 [Anaplasma platys]
MFDLYGVICASLFGVALYVVITKLMDLVHQLKKKKKARSAKIECNTKSAAAHDANSKGSAPPKRLVSAYAKQTKKFQVGVDAVDQVFPGAKGRKR